MLSPTTLLLGAIAGFTIFLGLPIARWQRASLRLKALLNAIASGILVFLFWDVLTEATGQIESTIPHAQSGSSGEFIALVVLFFGGIAIGLLSLVFFERRMLVREQSDVSSHQLALMIATGIGLHNFSEGLAIGQASVTGAIGLATILIIGFGLHNATEGFGIAAPLASSGRPSWKFLGLVGLIGGGPTFLGTLLGSLVVNPQVFIFCLALAAGSILYVIGELFHIGRKFPARELVMVGLIIGFFLGYGTDLIVVWGGA
jgi:ZIP family zinc transporter